MVEETCSLDRRPVPWLSMIMAEDLSEDWDRIEPHQERFPTAVEAALFAVLLGTVGRMGGV